MLKWERMAYLHRTRDGNINRLRRLSQTSVTQPGITNSTSVCTVKKKKKFIYIKSNVSQTERHRIVYIYIIYTYSSEACMIPYIYSYLWCKRSKRNDVWLQYYTMFCAKWSDKQGNVTITTLLAKIIMMSAGIQDSSYVPMVLNELLVTVSPSNRRDCQYFTFMQKYKPLKWK